MRVKKSVPASKRYRSSPKASRPPASRPKTSRRRSGRGRWLWIWLGLTGVGMVSAMAGAMLAVSLSATPLRQVFLSAEDDAIFNQDDAIAWQNLRFPELTRPVNILILGTKVLTSDVDGGADNDLGYHALVNSFEGLSDTMLLLRFDPASQELTVLSIPRDTRATIQGHGEMKINAANYHGGPALAARAASDLLDGLPIDRYVRLNVQGVEKLIDALGGVTVHVPKDMKYTDHSQHLYIDLKAGEQKLDGDKAMQFLRFRYDQYGDIGRVQRQQTLMRAIVEQTLRPQTLARIPQILQVIRENLDTNLSVEEMAALAGFASQVERSEIQMLLLPGDFNGTGEQGASYWLPSDRRIDAMLAEHFDLGYANAAEVASPAALSVVVQNSTDAPAAAEQLRQHLRQQGYVNTALGSRWSEPLDTTRILAQRGDERSARELQAALGFGEVRVESTGSLDSDLTVLVGSDWQQLPVQAD